jgi:hypothetical protein
MSASFHWGFRWTESRMPKVCAGEGEIEGRNSVETRRQFEKLKLKEKSMDTENTENTEKTNKRVLPFSVFSVPSVSRF